jgi:HAD superfamily hydrolase (TIGR01509 family)
VSTLKSLGIFENVHALVTSDDVLHGKPAPDTFLLCAKLLGVEPQYCQVFEDGNAGIEAAKNAGMMVVNVLEYL